MAKIRIGLGSEFNLKDQKLGLGTDNPQTRLDVAGVAKGKDLKVTGVSSLTAYEGFLRADHQIVENTTLSFDQGPSSSLSGEIIVGTGVTVTIQSVGLGTTTVGVGTFGTEYSGGTITNTIDTTDVTRAGGSEIESLKVYNTFNPPVGGTNDRPYAAKPGQLYYNQDFKTIEFWDGNNWRQVDYTTRSGRGVIMGGRTTNTDPISALTPLALISYIQISTRGNALNFGDLEAARETGGCLGSETRSIKGGGTAPSPAEEQNDIQYVTIASLGNAVDFGDLTNRVRSMGSVSSSTRGLFASGVVHPNTDTAHIDYIQISTTGSTLDFNGDHVAARNVVAIGSPIKACFGNGNSSTAMRTVNFATQGNTVFFGDATQDTSGSGTVGNSVRGIFCGGYLVPLGHGCPAIGSITFASLGNTTDFGEMNGLHQTAHCGGMSSATKGVFGPGQSPFAGSNDLINYLDEIMISTQGIAQDFGDSGRHGNFNPKVSDSHGGLGGF